MRTPAAAVTALTGAPMARPAKSSISAVTVNCVRPSSPGSVAVPAALALAASGVPSPFTSTTEACNAVTAAVVEPLLKAGLFGAGSMPLRAASACPMKASALMTAWSGTPPARSGYRTVQGIAISAFFQKAHWALASAAVPVLSACAAVTSPLTGSTAPSALVTRNARGLPPAKASAAGRPSMKSTWWPAGITTLAASESSNAALVGPTPLSRSRYTVRASSAPKSW